MLNVELYKAITKLSQAKYLDVPKHPSCDCVPCRALKFRPDENIDLLLWDLVKAVFWEKWRAYTMGLYY